MITVTLESTSLNEELTEEQKAALGNLIYRGLKEEGMGEAGPLHVMEQPTAAFMDEETGEVLEECECISIPLQDSFQVLSSVF